jgi:dTDP-4-amino-4,6-dideoxygalactose transaminase
MGSGTQALAAAVALAISRSNLDGATPEVILPAYGCPDLIAAVMSQGARPVLVDLLPDCPFMDTEKVSQALSDATVAVIAVGFLGVPERVSLLASICRDRGAWLIEDSAQCFPPDCAREPVADCAVLSFGRGKPINLMGGGALLVRGDHNATAEDLLLSLPEGEVKVDWQWKARRHIFNFLLGRLGYGLLRRIPFLGLGTTVYRPLDSIRRIRLPAGLVEAGIAGAEQRPASVTTYGQELEFLAQCGWKLFMSNKASGGNGAGQVTLRYGVLAPHREVRDKAIEALNHQGIGANAFYGRILPDIDGVPGVLVSSSDRYPNANTFADRLITLPSHEDVTVHDILGIAATLRAVGTEPDAPKKPTQGPA